ncbi:hypothetical protein AVEN_195994-1 [Araneus ventricosus]|uniref:Uncharacterized protein n=1 Tax=Araneus ventricosus TaxID=182803 RepID=A0A4Y2DRA9_ARAVE|nr:hypothetical protein AVEN_195994-1 [Araneus ventricosus]
MLSKNVQENGSDLDLHLPFLLFAYMKVPHSTTGISPYHLEKVHEIVAGNAEKNHAKYTRRYNLRAREKTFLQVGEKFLILESVSPHILLKKWIGPVSIIALTIPHSVLVRMEDGASKEVHVNKIRPNIARVQQGRLVFEQYENFGDLHYAPADTIRGSLKFSTESRTF